MATVASHTACAHNALCRSTCILPHSVVTKKLADVPCPHLPVIGPSPAHEQQQVAMNDDL